MLNIEGAIAPPVPSPLSSMFLCYITISTFISVYPCVDPLVGHAFVSP